MLVGQTRFLRVAIVQHVVPADLTKKRMDLVAKPDLDFRVKLKLSLSTIKKDMSKLKPLLKLIKDLER